MRTDLKKARNGVIAAALGAALLMGGGTYALWSATAISDGGSIEAGDLNITADEPRMFDISSDMGYQADVTVGNVTVGQGTEVDSDFRMVPGDTVALVFSYDIVLVGQNLKADLTLGGVDVTDKFDGLELTYDLYDGDGVQLVTAGTLSGTDTSVLPGLTEATNPGSVVLVIYAAFDRNTEDRDGAGTTLLELSNNVTMTLAQDRPTP